MRAIALLLAVLLAGCAGRTTDRGPFAAEPPEATATADASTSGSAAGPDPVAAALRYVASTDALMAHSAIGRREILRALVTPSAVDEQVAGIESAVARLADELGIATERLTWVEAPLSAKLSSRGDGVASVDVWAVSVLGAPDTGPPQQAWRTVHVDLVLVDDVWLVSGADAETGPTPAANDLALPAGWDEFSTVARWAPVVEGARL